MSESVKKRVRPTWGMVRSLESELSELRDRYGQQSKELGNARKELSELRSMEPHPATDAGLLLSLQKEVSALKQSLEYRDMEKHADEELLEKKRKTIEELKASERQLRERYSQLKQQLEAMADENVDLRMENARLVNRGFLDRLFNR